MKKLPAIIFLFCIITFYSPAEDMDTEDVSYAFGMFIASDLMEIGLEFNYEALMQGFRDFMEDRHTRFTVDEAIEILESTFERIHNQEMERLEAEAEMNRLLGSAFLAENRQRPGVIVTASGLQFELLDEGDGDVPRITDTVRVHYRGALLDGTVFDSTYDYGEDISFPLDSVIPGWSEGLRMMREGSRAMLYVPPELAYGAMGAGGIIPPNSVLIFEVEFIEIVR